MAVGFAAQLVDGALGMAYGQISSTLLISLGVPPAAASAGVHASENVYDRRLEYQPCRSRKCRLASVFPSRDTWSDRGHSGRLCAHGNKCRHCQADRARLSLDPRPLSFLSGIMHRHTERRPKIVSPLGLIGGFLDAAGGGGWGGIVTSNLLVQGGNPRKTIGTVNTAEFFLTITISATFLATLGWKSFTVATAGLLFGGVLAAPFGARIAQRVNPDTLLTFVGALLTMVSFYGLYRALM